MLTGAGELWLVLTRLITADIAVLPMFSQSLNYITTTTEAFWWLHPNNGRPHFTSGNYSFHNT
ncbi:hypothetical protein OMCYN_01638 [cyanobiont of Ornithocercus magnificus]|nr:hypothetical protein OMCYN_01638 [cyanobiont of Ornithocercus magnificus]